MTSNIAISLFAGSRLGTVSDVIEAVQRAVHARLDGCWIPQTTSVDAITALAVAGTLVPDVPLGTAVVPIQGRHPIPLAQQVLTVVQAVGQGRFTLGLGVTHPSISEGWYGVSYRDVVALCGETLEALEGLLSSRRAADFVGSHLTARTSLSLDAPRPSVVLAALGPRMLELAGRHTDGTVTWMTGPVSLRTVVVPAIRDAAERAGRPAPRVIVGLPVCVTHQIEDLRNRIRPRMSSRASFPSYRRMLASEGLDDPADLAIVGSEDLVSQRIHELEAVGASELIADVDGTDDERDATLALLRSLTAAGRC